MLCKRVIVCLDVRAGLVTKGVRFQGNVDLGDPVEFAARYDAQGADELVFYDITASAEKRTLFLDVVRRVAERIFIPFAVGGGIRDLETMRAVLLAGAEKVSINSPAVRDPELITRGARAFGSQCIVLGMDVRRCSPSRDIPSGYEVVIDGGRTPTGRDAVAWAKEAVARGAGEICLNAIDTDGVRQGYELRVTRLIADAVAVPVIASGGGGEPAHCVAAVTEGGADAALVASMVHYGHYTVGDIKLAMRAAGVPVRPLFAAAATPPAACQQAPDSS
ncbi:MAG: imidazole glycerol phosphate synthase subunit HisF [Planctomycetota bacterium]|nr:imidazole glycerol phosphate synthase subunit HisF [Planctomycetota bacterium]MDW8373109.1 imidazole glycerol phosphate synthase subunit HisF [Planctomycetota bacterium]